MAETEPKQAEEEQGGVAELREFARRIDDAVEVIDHSITMLMDERSTGVPEEAKLKAANASAVTIGFLSMMRDTLLRQAGDAEAAQRVEAMASRIILPGEE